MPKMRTIPVHTEVDASQAQKGPVPGDERPGAQQGREKRVFHAGFVPQRFANGCDKLLGFVGEEMQGTRVTLKRYYMKEHLALLF
jgi:hypothetical protein